MKQTIRLNENELKGLIKKGVMMVLKESNHPHHRILKEDSSDQVFMDDLYDMGYEYEEDYYRNECDKICADIKKGLYDDKIKDEEWVAQMEDNYEDDDCGTFGDIGRAIHDRLCLIDKKYALKNGKQNNPFMNNYSYHHPDYVRDSDDYKYFANVTNLGRNNVMLNNHKEWTSDSLNESIRRAIRKVLN